MCMPCVQSGTLRKKWWNKFLLFVLFWDFVWIIFKIGQKQWSGMTKRQSTFKEKKLWEKFSCTNVFLPSSDLSRETCKEKILAGLSKVPSMCSDEHFQRNISEKNVYFFNVCGLLTKVLL